MVPVVEKITKDANVQTQKVDGSNAVIIKTRSLDLEEREAFNKAMVDNFDVDESLITSENIQLYRKFRDEKRRSCCAFNRDSLHASVYLVPL